MGPQHMEGGGSQPRLQLRERAAAYSGPFWGEGVEGPICGECGRPEGGGGPRKAWLLGVNGGGGELLEGVHQRPEAPLGQLGVPVARGPGRRPPEGTSHRTANLGAPFCPVKCLPPPPPKKCFLRTAPAPLENCCGIGWRRGGTRRAKRNQMHTKRVEWWGIRRKEPPQNNSAANLIEVGQPIGQRSRLFTRSREEEENCIPAQPAACRPPPPPPRILARGRTRPFAVEGEERGGGA